MPVHILEALKEMKIWLLRKDWGIADPSKEGT